MIRGSTRLISIYYYYMQMLVRFEHFFFRAKYDVSQCNNWAIDDL